VSDPARNAIAQRIGGRASGRRKNRHCQHVH
jgi:hypothetical protein